MFKIFLLVRNGNIFYSQYITSVATLNQAESKVLELEAETGYSAYFEN